MDIILPTGMSEEQRRRIQAVIDQTVLGGSGSAINAAVIDYARRLNVDARGPNARIQAVPPTGPFLPTGPVPPTEPAVKYGPEPPKFFFWDGKRYELDIAVGSRPWQLLVYLWGKRSAPIRDIAEKVWLNKRTKYKSMKSTIFNLNAEMERSGLPCTWNKAKKADYLIYTGAPYPSLVQE